jgi:hypothetical protein
VPPETPNADISIAGQIEACAALCAQTLMADYPEFAGAFSTDLRTPRACFDVLGGIPHNPAAMDALRSLEQQAQAAGFTTPYWIERFVVLQACLEALPLLPALPVDDSVRVQFCAMCRHLAGPLQARDTRLARQGDAFTELAKLITFRRFHAGQLSYDIMDMPRAWLLKVHPTALPSLARELWNGFGGMGPVIMPHINYWRPNPLFVTLKEQERSLRRIAKSIAGDTRIKGFISSSWVYGEAVGETTPHLAWLRDFFAANNAFIIDAGPALDDAGFLMGSDKRRQLHAEGKFAPRETLVLWRRPDFLAWAARQDGAGPKASGAEGAPARPRARGPRDPGANLRSGRYTVLDYRRVLYYEPRRYIAFVLGVPALAAALVAAELWGLGAVLPAMALAVLTVWLAQYFFLQ